MSDIPAAISVNANITIIHSEGKMHTTIVPMPRNTKAQPAAFRHFLFRRLIIKPPRNECSSHYTGFFHFGASTTYNSANKKQLPQK